MWTLSDLLVITNEQYRLYIDDYSGDHYFDEIFMLRNAIVIAVILLAVLVGLFAPIEVPYAIECSGKIVPLREWRVVREQDGQIRSILYDNMAGRVQSYAVLDMERGDHIKIDMYPSAALGAVVQTGAEVGRVHSRQLTRQLVHLQGELASAEAEIKLLSGSKREAVVDEARTRLLQVQTRVGQQRRIVTRLQTLFAINVASKEDLELAQDALALDSIQVEIASAQLRAAQMGARSEEIEVGRTRLAALQGEIEALEERLRDNVLVAPLSGLVTNFFSGDTLLVVQDTTGYAAALPVRWQERDYVAVGQPVELMVKGRAAPLSATVRHIGRTAFLLNGAQFFGATAQVAAEGVGLAAGLVVRCSIPCGSVKLSEYVRRVLAF